MIGPFLLIKIFISMGKELITKLLREGLIDESNIVNIEKLLPNVDEITNKQVLPVVKILYTAIKKVKGGKYNELNGDEKGYLNTIFRGMVNTRTKELKSDYSIPSEDPTTIDNLTNVYNLKTLKGDETSVGVGFHYEPNNTSFASYMTMYNWIIINMATVTPSSINELKSTIRHELVHAVDPKVLNPELYHKMNPDVDTDSYNQQKYHKSLHEFDAFSHEMINVISKNFDKLKKYDSDGQYKDSVCKQIWDIVDSIPTMGYETLVSKYDGELVTRFFTENGITLKSNNTIFSNFQGALILLDSWATKPTLYRRFKQRLVKYVPYKK